jgi:hypothetical protein
METICNFEEGLGKQSTGFENKEWLENVTSGDYQNITKNNITNMRFC